MSGRIAKIFLLTVLILLSKVSCASASFEITEIMYDLEGTDTNREWVEVKNTGSESADLSKWYFFSDNSKHSLTPLGVSNVPPNEFAIIAQNATKFKNDWPNYTGLLFDSSWTGFNNDGETIGLKDPELNIASSVTFASSQGGAGDATSLQKVNNSWRGAAPTPGLASQDASSTSTNTSSSVSGSTVPVPPKKKEIEVPRIITNIIAPASTSAGIEFPVSSKTDGYSKEDLTSGRFAWNFGDGITKDIFVSTPFTHQYKYPGQYVITLTYYRYYKNTIPDATDRFTIMVLPAELTIASVGPTSDPYVELENKSSVEINISKWYIKTSSKIFFIPEGTIILPHQKLRFSSLYTFFTMSDLDSLTLFTAQGVVFDTFPKEINSTRGSHTERRSVSLSPVKYSVGNQVQTSPSTIIDLNTLSGQAAGATKDVPQNMLLWMALIGVIILGGLSTFLLKQPQRENDIPDNKIQASDIDIV